MKDGEKTPFEVPAPPSNPPGGVLPGEMVAEPASEQPERQGLSRGGGDPKGDPADKPFKDRRIPRAERAERRPGRGVLGWMPDVLVVAMLVVAGVAAYADLGDRLGLAAPDPLSQPAEVKPPPGLDLPAIAAARAVATPLEQGSADPAKVAAAVTALLSDPKLGQPTVRVVDAGSGTVVYQRGGASFMPASTNKLLTSTAALAAIGPGTRFPTVVRRGQGDRIVLVGGGDPYLASTPPESGTYPPRADLTTLARRTAAQLKVQKVAAVSLGFDDSRFSGPRVNPAWEPGYVPSGEVSPISALWVDEGRMPSSRATYSDPAAHAADVFAQALRRAGIAVTGAPKRQTIAATAPAVAAVASPTLGQIVSRLLLVSDNNAAEVVAHQVGVAEGTGGSFAGGAQAVLRVLGRIGVPTSGVTLYDGSGLSRRNLVTPAAMAGTLMAASDEDRPQLREVVTGMPVAGFTGSLTYRFDDGAPAGRGRVQAKTGTLTGVHGLAGVATDLDGDVLVFVAVANQVPEDQQLFARQRIDQVAAALGACHCRVVATPSPTPASPGETPAG